jgi:hypothetical protein
LRTVLHVREDSHALRHRLPLQSVVHDHATHGSELGVIALGERLLFQQDILLDFKTSKPSHEISAATDEQKVQGHARFNRAPPPQAALGATALADRHNGNQPKHN